MTYVIIQAEDIHIEFMKAIDACNVKFDAAKVINWLLKRGNCSELL